MWVSVSQKQKWKKGRRVPRTHAFFALGAAFALGALALWVTESVARVGAGCVSSERAQAERHRRGRGARARARRAATHFLTAAFFAGLAAACKWQKRVRL